MITRKIEKTDDGYDLILFGADQYVRGKDAVISDMMQRLLLIKGELPFDFPSILYTQGVGMPVFDKLDKFELDLEIRNIILSVPSVYNISKYESRIVRDSDNINKYVADFVAHSSEGEIVWQITV